MADERKESRWFEVPKEVLDDLDVPVGATTSRASSRDPLIYAAAWNQPLLARNGDAFERALDRWTDYYRERGVGAIALGAVALRRRPDGDPGGLVNAVSGPDGPGATTCRACWMPRHCWIASRATRSSKRA